MLRYAGTCESLYFPTGQTPVFLTGGYYFNVLYSSVSEYLHEVIGKDIAEGYLCYDNCHTKSITN